VIIFNEGDFTAEHQDQLRALCPSIEFRQINIDPPPWIATHRAATWAMPRFGVGYRNMYRLFALGLYPYIEDLDYYMRLDDDSFVLSPITRDPFKHMVENDVHYMYRSRTRESTKAVVGLTTAVHQHDKDFTRKIVKYIFYNNYHVARRAMFTEEPFASALDYIDKRGGIYTGRWGDAPIHTLLLEQYLIKGEIEHDKSFKYQHGRHTWAVGQ